MSILAASGAIYIITFLHFYWLPLIFLSNFMVCANICDFSRNQLHRSALSLEMFLFSISSVSVVLVDQLLLSM